MRTDVMPTKAGARFYTGEDETEREDTKQLNKANYGAAASGKVPCGSEVKLLRLAGDLQGMNVLWREPLPCLALSKAVMQSTFVGGMYSRDSMRSYGQ